MKPRSKLKAARASARRADAKMIEDKGRAAIAGIEDIDGGSFLSCLARPGMITGDDSPQAA